MFSIEDMDGRPAGNAAFAVNATFQGYRSDFSAYCQFSLVVLYSFRDGELVKEKRVARVTLVVQLLVRASNRESPGLQLLPLRAELCADWRSLVRCSLFYAFGLELICAQAYWK